MPVFKIAAKRVARKEREDALGISALKAKMREAGEDVPDSDFDDSDSDSDSDNDEDSDDESDDGEELSDEDDISSDEDEEDGEDGELGEQELGSDEEGIMEEREEEEEEEGDSDDDEDDFNLAIEDVATSPLWPTDSFPAYCVLCPDKLLKKEHVANDHLASTAHKRALKRWETRLADTTRPLPSDDPRDVVMEMLAALQAASEPKKTKTQTSTQKVKSNEKKSAETAGEKNSKGGKTQKGEKKTAADPTVDSTALPMNRRERRALQRAAEGKAVPDAVNEKGGKNKPSAAARRREAQRAKKRAREEAGAADGPNRAERREAAKEEVRSGKAKKRRTK